MTKDYLKEPTKNQEELISEYKNAGEVQEEAKDNEDYGKACLIEGYRRGLEFARGWCKPIKKWDKCSDGEN